MVVPELATPDSGYIEDCLPPSMAFVDMSVGGSAATEGVLESSFNSIIALSGIAKLPGAARYWQNVLDDITEVKQKRFQRVQRRSENVHEFINRFPIGVEEIVEDFEEHVSF